MKDIEYFDKLPASIKSALREAPKPFSAKFAWQLLQQGFTERQVLNGLQEAIREWQRDGTMPYLGEYKPLIKKPRQRYAKVDN